MKYFLKDCTKKVLKIYKSIVIENFKPGALCPIKWRPFKVFAKLHKDPIFIADIVKGTVLELKTIFGNGKPLKNNVKWFLFHLKSSFRFPRYLNFCVDFLVV